MLPIDELGTKIGGPSSSSLGIPSLVYGKDLISCFDLRAKSLEW